MYPKSRSVILSIALIGVGLAAGGRGADDGGTHGPDGSLTTSLIAGLAETAGSAVAYAQARRNCEAARRGTRSRRCVRRTAWNFANTTDTNFDPQLTPDGRFVVFASKENLDEDPNDIPPANPESEDLATLDVFRQDLERNTPPLRVSVDPAGNLVTGPSGTLADSGSPAVSANGRLVAFATDGAFLPEDRNSDSFVGAGDVYLKNLATGRLTLVSAARGRPPRLAVGGVPLELSFSGTRFVAMSDNGRFVAFMTNAVLDARDGNTELDVYVRDLRTDRYFLASIDGSENAGGVSQSTIDISANGRFVAFSSSAALDPADDNGLVDVYVWDRQRPRATPILVSRGAEVQPGGLADSSSPALSANGRFIAFESSARLLAEDTNGVRDIYRFDRISGEIVRVSLDAQGRETAVDDSRDPAISANGRFVAFSSGAGDLVLNDTSFGSTVREGGLPAEDIFVKDLRTGAITRASVDADGIETDGTSFSPSLSAGGNLIAFLTDDARIILPDPALGPGVPPGDAVVVTGVNFAALPAVDIAGAPPGAPSIDIDPGFELDFALRNTIDRPGDQDWFRVSLVAGNTYTIDLEGRPSRQGTLDDPLLRILVPKIPGVDQDGLEALDDDGGQGLNARLRYEARATGVHFISAEGFGNATGTYRLLVREQ